MSSLIYLRELNPMDSARTAAWKNDPLNRDLAAGYFFPSTEVDERAWQDANSNARQTTKIVFAVALRETGEAVGLVNLNEIHWVHRTAFLGIMIGSKEYQGRGIGTEALRELLNYAFRVLNLRKISLQVVAFNERAVRLYRQFGFVQEGRLEGQYYLRGEYQDALIFSLTRSQHVTEP